MGNLQPNTDAQDLGARVKSAREAKGLSVARLAEMAGVSKAYVHQIENGECQRPSAQVLFNIATILGTSVAHLLGRGPSGPEPGAAEIPDSLREFAATQPDMTPEDVEMLSRIKHRGNQPQTAKDWEYLWESIKRTVR